MSISKLKELITEIDSFEEMCDAEEYTDPEAFWIFLNWIKEELEVVCELRERPRQTREETN